MSDTKLFTTSALLEHVASHQDRNIIVIHDIVYDVTDFLDEVSKIILKLLALIYD